ncbi:MAG: hypothetical protein FWE17_02640 [Alphaproteobacteria bacterium]|nr:hypothetical protein [Alphaproteobacteria bacterium]MCL2758524.1 hypothetical protein [Alphaproteobacteria bacterium]
MKKIMLFCASAVLLSGCIGFVENRAHDGRVVHDMYFLHPAITITGYTSGLTITN